MQFQAEGIINAEEWTSMVWLKWWNYSHWFDSFRKSALAMAERLDLRCQIQKWSKLRITVFMKISVDVLGFVLPARHQPFSSPPANLLSTLLAPAHELPPVFSSHCLGSVMQGLVQYQMHSFPHSLLKSWSSSRAPYISKWKTSPSTVICEPRT